MSPLKVRIWAERSDVMQCWVWRYSTSDGTWTTSTRRRQALGLSCSSPSWAS